jgi:hypothetical protein
MPPPPPPWVRGDPNRDYQLLPADDAEAAAQQAKPVAPGRLFQLARPELWRLAVASLFLLAGSLGQVAFPKLAGEPGGFVRRLPDPACHPSCCAALLSARPLRGLPRVAT